MNKISTLLFLIFLTCTSGVFADSGSSISLNGTWELSYWMQPEEPITSPKDMQLAEVKHLSAQVPGNVELDLMAANLIKDPMIGSNVNELRKWEGYQWCYSKSFTLKYCANKVIGIKQKNANIFFIFIFFSIYLSTTF